MKRLMVCPKADCENRKGCDHDEAHERDDRCFISHEHVCPACTPTNCRMGRKYRALRRGEFLDPEDFYLSRKGIEVSVSRVAGHPVHIPGFYRLVEE